MLCEKCGKKEAAVHYSENINGKMKNMALCLDCAKTEQITTSSMMSSFFTGTASEYLSDRQKKSPAVSKTCPVCKISYEEIRRTAKVGCAECYHTFSDELAPAIKRIHGGAVHKGTVPNSAQTVASDKEANNIEASDDSSIARLERELADAVAKENYEHAAVIRDNIRSMTENN